MLGVTSTHEPIRGEFAKAVRAMLSKERNVEPSTPRKNNKWIVKTDTND